MIVRIPRNSKLRQSIRSFYNSLYKKFKEQNPDDKTYTRKKLIQNIKNILSVDGTTINELDIKNSTYNEWDSKGYKEFSYNTWFFAVVVSKTVTGEVIGMIQDGHHNSQHHNDEMQTQPYDESVKKMLSLIERIENL